MANVHTVYKWKCACILLHPRAIPQSVLTSNLALFMPKCWLTVHQGKWNPGLHPLGQCWRQRQDHPNFLSAYQAAPGLLHAVLGPTDQERCRKTGESQRKLWRWSKGWGSFPEENWRSFISSSWRRDCSWIPHHSISILKGWIQRKWKFSL